MADNPSQDWLKKIVESGFGVRLDQGVICKTSHAMIAVVEERATAVFDSVRGFMRHLATRLSE